MRESVSAALRAAKWSRAALGIAYEAGRHLLRRPVAGFIVFGQNERGEWLLIRRGDTGTWAFPGGTLEWGETLRQAVPRELEEEAGVLSVQDVTLCGAWSGPGRDPRFHALSVGVRARLGASVKPPKNPLEIREVGWFSADQLPHPLALGHSDFFRSLGTDAALE